MIQRDLTNREMVFGHDEIEMITIQPWGYVPCCPLWGIIVNQQQPATIVVIFGPGWESSG